MNKNDKIEWTEFYSYMRSIVERKESLETIKASFKEFDIDGDGYVDAEELELWGVLLTCHTATLPHLLLHLTIWSR